MSDKKSDPVLTDYDITINSIHQENMFKGTIAICILYAGFAFILITAAYFSDNIRDLLFDKFLPFTLVYIIGTIIIIMIFIYFILSFEPKKVDINKIDDNISCPDYWKLEILDDTAIDKSFDINNYNKKLFKYRCVMDDKVFNKGSIYKQDKQTGDKITNQYRLGNKPAFIGDKDGASYGNTVNYNDLYPTDAGALDSYLTNNNENDKYYYLYKDLNAYNASNLNYTYNKAISSNILKDLKESSLIMNNYKYDKKSESYFDITNSGNNDYVSNDGTNLSARYTSNYYNSPPILTWATSNALNNPTSAQTSTGYNNAPVGDVTNSIYTSTVYDWSTMTDKTTGKVFAVDFTIPPGPTNNNIELGEIRKDIDNKIYFKGNVSITIGAALFINKKINNNYYFDETYIATTTPTAHTASSSGMTKGPKVRIFNKTERQPVINNSILPKEHIPLTCSAVYPSFLASKEDKYSENNTLRCAYSKICNIPWSDLHCNDINLS